MFIEVKGVQFINKGAELMLVAIEQQLNKSKLASEHNLVLSPRNSPFSKRADYKSFQKIGNLFKRIDWSKIDFLVPKKICETYGLCKHADVNVVLDASGFAYGQQWTPAMLAHSVRQSKLMKIRGAKYIYLPQAFGPFHNDKYKKLINEAVNNCTLMYVRDPISYKYVTDIVGEKEHVILSPDFTNLVDLNESVDGLIVNEKLATIIPNNKMLGKESFNSLHGKNYIHELVSAGIELQKLGYHVLVLNHEGVKDLKLCEDIYSQLDISSASLLNDLSPLSVKKQIGLSKLVICSRYHGCVSALSQNIPVIGTSWSHKYEMLFSDYDVLDLLYKFKTDLKVTVADIDRRLDNISENLIPYSLAEKNKVKNMWDKVFKTIT